MNFMKSIFKTIALVVVLTPLFMSCEPKEESKYENGYYISVATMAESEDGKIYFQFDDAKTLYPVNLQNAPDSVMGKRSWFQHRVYKEAYSEEGYDLTSDLLNFYPTVKINDYVEVADEDQNNTYGNDPIGVDRIWVSGDYLNVAYNFYAKDTDKHAFTLVRKMYEAKPDDKAIKLEFRHDDQEDALLKGWFTVCSFDISELLPAAGAKQAFEFTYKYSTTEPSRTIKFELEGDKAEKVQEFSAGSGEKF